MNRGYVGSRDFDIMVSDVGPDKKARLKSLFNYLQATIDMHSREKGTSATQLESRNLSWVYARFYAEVREYPSLYQSVTCRTWLSKLEPYLAHRDFTISDDKGEVMMVATGSLALINRDTRRPVEIKTPAGKVIEIYPERSVEFIPSRIPEMENYAIAYRTAARYEDIDINNHMNNASYAQMFFESLAGQVNGSELSSIDIVFRGEVSLRDELSCMCDGAGEGVYHHKMVNETRGGVSAFAVTRWRNAVRPGIQ